MSASENDEEEFGSITGFSGRMTLPAELLLATRDELETFMATSLSLLDENGLRIGNIDTMEINPIDNSISFAGSLTHEHSLRVEEMLFGRSDINDPQSPDTLTSIRLKCMCGHRETYSTNLSGISVPCREHVECRGQIRCLQIPEPIRLNIDCDEVEISGGTGA